MQLTETQNKIFAILFAAGEPVENIRIAEALSLTPSEAKSLTQSVGDWLDESGCPLELKTLNDSYQLCTISKYSDIIRQVLDMRRNVPLSPAAMETLAVVAYNQPVTRSFVEQVRGVDSSSVMSLLVEKGLIEESGRLELPGRPIAYKTTLAFLRCFGISDLSELPQIKDDTGEDGSGDSEESLQLILDPSLPKSEDPPAL